MKTAGSQTVSHIWQLVHLRHYFGQDLASKTICQANPEANLPKQNSHTAGDRHALTTTPQAARYVRKPLAAWPPDRS
jgi:hypothetical protein